MPAAPNKLSRIIARVAKLPPFIQPRVLSGVIGRTVKFAGTANLEILEMTRGRVRVRLANRRPVQNHIGGVHAAAMALLAESATGFVVAMSVADTSVPVIKSLKVDYLKRTEGAMEATATLSEEDLTRIEETDKGELVVPVAVTDESGREPINCEMVWAWVPKRRSSTP